MMGRLPSFNRSALSATLLLGMALPVSTLADTPAAEGFARQAESFLQAKRYPEAIVAFQNAARANPAAGAYYTARAGHIQSWSQNDPRTALVTFRMALSMEGGQQAWILREIGVAHARLQEFAQAREQLQAARRISETAFAKGEQVAHGRELAETLGWSAHVANAQENYSAALEIALEGYRLAPQSESHVLACEGSEAATRLAHQNLIDGDFLGAAKHYGLAESTARRSSSCYSSLTNRRIPEHVRVSRELSAMGRIDPHYSFRACIVYVRHADFDFKSALGNQRVQAKGSISDREIRRAEVAQRLLQRYVEAFTNGRLSMSFTRTTLDATFTEIDATIYNGGETRIPVLESAGDSLSDYFFANREQCDGFFIYWNGHGTATTANGGLLSFPYLAYQKYSPLRGFISFPASWDSSDASIGMLHEFFHVTEGTFGITPTHGFLAPTAFPQWKGKDQFDYFRYHFERWIPANKGANPWRSFALPERFPEKTTPELLAVNRLAVARIPREQLRLARAKSQEASKLYYSGSDRAGGIALFRQALAQNPHEALALQTLAGVASAEGDYAKAEEYYARLTTVEPDVWSLSALGALRIWHLQRPADALAPLAQAIRLAGPNGPTAGSFYNLGHAHLRLEQFAKSLDAFESVRSAADNGTGKPSLRTQSTFWIGFLYGEKFERRSEAYAFVKEAVDAGWNDDFSRFYLKKYAEQNTARTRSAQPAPPISNHSRWQPTRPSIDQRGFVSGN